VAVGPSRPRVSCHLILSTVFSGAEKVVVDELNALDRGRFAPALVCTEANEGAFRQRLKEDVRLVSIRSGKRGWARDPGLAVRVWRALRAVSPRILCCHNNAAWNLGTLLRSAVGRPGLVITEHINLTGLAGQSGGSGRSARMGAYLSVMHRLWQRKTRFIAVSPSVRRYFEVVYGLPEERIDVLENGIPIDDYPYAFRASPRLRDELEIDGSVPLLVVVGRLETQKGHIYLNEALASLKEEWPALHAVYLGEGPLRGTIAADLEAKGMGSVVHLLGFRDDLKEILAAADVFVLPSLWEGLPIAVLEALSTGLPVVATAVDGTPRIITDGVDGLLVPPSDPEALAAAIHKLLRDPERARALGERGRRTVQERFDVHRRVARLEDIMEAVA